MAVSLAHAHGYAAYLNSPEWKQKRLEALRRANYRCEACPETESLEVHHLTYDRLGFERPQDLRVLCNPCHSQEHGRGAKNDRVVGVREADARINARELELELLEREQERILRTVAAEMGREVDLDPDPRTGCQPPWLVHRCG